MSSADRRENERRGRVTPYTLPSPLMIVSFNLILALEGVYPAQLAGLYVRARQGSHEMPRVGLARATIFRQLRKLQEVIMIIIINLFLAFAPHCEVILILFLYSCYLF